LKIVTSLYKAKVDIKTGALVSFRSTAEESKERLSGPSFIPVLSRAWLDNDLGGAEKYAGPLLRPFISSAHLSYKERWTQVGLDKYTESYVWPKVKVETKAADLIEVHRRDANVSIATTYRFRHSRIEVEFEVKWIGKKKPDCVPRIGALVEVMPKLSTVSFCGRGDKVECYPDRKSGALQ
jgi:hypothetical protein